MARRGTYADELVVREIARICRESQEEGGRTPTAPAVKQMLQRSELLESVDIPGDDRTIRKIMKEVAAANGEPWKLVDADPEQAAAVAPVLAELSIATHGSARSLTTKEAHIIHVIRRVAPDLPAKSVWFLMLQYVFDEGDEEDISPYYDMLLTQGIWRSAVQRKVFDKIIERVPDLDHRDKVLLRVIADSIQNDVREQSRPRRRNAKKEEPDGKRTRPKTRTQVGRGGGRGTGRRREA